jgi:hypothetical protein
MPVIDYLDADVAYLLGMLVARGELLTGENTYRVIVHLPKGALLARGVTTQFDTDKEIRLGMEKIRERLMELLGADIRTVDAGESWDLVIRMTRNTMAWRNINMLLCNKTSFPYFEIPNALFETDTPLEFKREFIRGYADVAGNVRPANRDKTGRHRVRLDILNYPTNWQTPVQLCLLLQDQLGISVPLITWGHPNLGRQWREHQLNVYPEDFLGAGFYFDYKQAALSELAELNLSRFPHRVKGCPGARRLGTRKKRDPDEQDADRLPSELAGRHFNAYWQICRALGCPRRPSPREQPELIPEE